MAQVKAVIDRFEEQHAVLLVGETQKQMVVPRKSLPGKAREGHWLKIEIEGETLVSAVIDKDETDRARQRIAEKLARLRQGDHL